MLGAEAETIALAADYARRTFPAWRIAGYHHGYLADEAANATAVDAVNAAHPDVLLVGMETRSKNSGSSGTCRISVCRSAWASGDCSITGRAM